MGIPIADTPEALTPAWLSEVLGAPVAAVSSSYVGTGQMCDSVRLTLGYEGPVPDDRPASVVAKLPAADPTSRATALQLRSYENEVRFYQQLAPELPMRTPAVFHADIDVETASFVLLLEDLAPAEQGDQLAGCTVERAQVAVDELVKLHAPRWGDRSLLELEWLARDPEQGRQLMLAMLPVFWSGFRDRYAERLGPEVHEVGDSLFTALDRYLVPADEHATVVHGDYRLDNLLFGGAGGGVPIAVVDWQTCAIGSALTDVAYFIGAGLLEDVRREAEGDLLRRYHDLLVVAGIDGYSWDRCQADYALGSFAGLVMALAASMLVERTARGDDMFMAMAHRHARHALDLDAPALLTS
ncbi:MAG: ecdysteroid 22-kinase family protein [Actinomycetota bacterium]|nr:ecdysteroid 22-kinase family protein [Actinomycetota bacterium]